MSGVLVATTVPAFLIGPFAGVFVDRWDKRRTMLAVNLIQAIVVALLLPVTGILKPINFSQNMSRNEAGFSAALQNEVDQEQVRSQLLAVVEETMQPTQTTLCLLQPRSSMS